MKKENLSAVDWSQLPAPEDDGRTDHLLGAALPSVLLPCSSQEKPTINPANLLGWSVIYVYPMMGKPGTALPENWDRIPGARGCTPQSCSFRDTFQELMQEGVNSLFGLSTQTEEEQAEAVQRLKLPFPLLSDSAGDFTKSLNLPTFTVEGLSLIKRLTLISFDTIVKKIFYPVFPPDQNSVQVLQWLKTQT